ncbi:MAG: DUF3048 domain-containing protein [Chloroflexota bacterium]
MIRRFLPVLGGALLTLSGCAGASTATSGVTTGLNGKSIPAIKLPPYVPGPLDGYSTPRQQALRRPLGIILENYAPDSRPQSGLGAASTVIETLAEGGVTRFLALYLERDAAKVGPVRSTRVYFNDWAAGFHAILGHVGGNDDAQAALWHLPKVFNLDENRWEVNLYNTGTPLFWRSANRVAPHNLYTSTYKLREYATQHGQDWTYGGASFLHKNPALLRARGHAGSLSLTFENPLYPQVNPDYDVRYVYDRASDTYVRYMGGAPHIDANTGKTLAPANVVVMQTGAAAFDPRAGITPQSITIPVIGRGVAWYFRDGGVQRGAWQQVNQNAPLQFFDRKGHGIALNPGQTWIEVVPASSQATWSFH